MKFKMIAMIAVAILAVGSTGTSALAQGCGCGGDIGGGFGADFGGYTGVVPGNYGSYGGFGNLGYDSTCGRGISSSQAAGLWGGYCTDDCTYNGPQRRGCLKGRHGGGGCFGGGGGGCCFGGDCFGYPSCGCGCGGGGHFGGGGCCLKRKLAGLRGPSINDCGGQIGGYGGYGSSCDCGGSLGTIGSYSSYGSSCGGGGGHFGGGGCGLKQKLSGFRSAPTSSCGRGGCLRGGCGVKGKFFNKMLNFHSQNAFTGFSSTDAYSSCSYLTSGCTSCGSNGGYFNEAVGYEYGNGGMQSYVSGALTGACGGGCGCGL